MKVGNQTVDTLETIAGIDKQVCDTGPGSYVAVAGGVFKGTNGRRPDRDYPPPLSPRGLDRHGRLLRNDVALRFHPMSSYLLHSDRTKRAGPDIEGYRGHHDTVPCERFNQVRRKVQR